MQPVDDEEAETGQRRRLGMARNDACDDPRPIRGSFHFRRAWRCGEVAATTLAPVGGVASDG